MLECYKEVNFKKKSVEMIDRMNAIIGEYLDAGYTLTVRQLYYQLVARDIVPNTEKSYKQISSLLNDARIAGHVDWDAIEDRTRTFAARPRWTSPQDILDSVAKQYHTDPWLTQPKRVFLVVEKEALVGVFQRVCRTYDIPLLAARGYPSASVLREFASAQIERAEQEIVILHFGDHDPSGLDMTRDLIERFEMFGWGHDFVLKRMALNRDQIEEHNPPPNPAKATDARFLAYRRRHGVSSWELDALPPTVLNDIAVGEIVKHVDKKAWAKWEAGLEKSRKRLITIAANYKE